MSKSTHQKNLSPCFKPGDVVNTRYGTGVILHAFIGSIHYNRPTTYSLELEGKRKPRVLSERELTPCMGKEAAGTASTPRFERTAARPRQLAAA